MYCVRGRISYSTTIRTVCYDSTSRKFYKPIEINGTSPPSTTGMVTRGALEYPRRWCCVMSDRPPGKFLVAIDGRRGITRRPATPHTRARGRAEGYFTLTHSRSFVGSEKQEMTRRTRVRVRPALVGVTGLCLIAGVEAKRSPRSVSSRHVSAESVWNDFAGSLATLGIDENRSCADLARSNAELSVTPM